MYYDNHTHAQFSQPTKVIHVRNLPFEVTDEEIIEMCSEFGSVIAVKGRIGEKKNQAFVEFAELESSIAIVTRYQGPADPARLRGRPVFMAYAGRDHLTNVTSSYTSPSPVVMARITHISETLAPLLTLEVLNAVFAAFGPVLKMALQPQGPSEVLAFVQYGDAAQAQAAKGGLAGARLPAGAFDPGAAPAAPGDAPLVEGLQYCSARNLVIPVQSAHTRDFTRPELAWGEPNRAYISSLVPAADAGGATRVLSITFDQATYPVTLEGLHTICSTYGAVQKIHTYERDARIVALVQYAEQSTATAAKAALEGHPMYGDGANVMRLVYSRHNDLVIRPGERSRDFVQYPPGTTPPTPTPTHGAAAPGAAGGQQGGQPAPAQQYAQQYVPRQGAPRQGGAAPQQGYGRPGGHPATQQQQQQYQARPGGYPGYPPPGSWGGAMAPQPYAAYGGYYHPQQYQGYPPPRPPHHQGYYQQP
ncbi:hypothetical protein ACKKBG_A24370 [Auxenochlorella protothecoides x Auxenochlorella symbiontica]